MQQKAELAEMKRQRALEEQKVGLLVEPYHLLLYKILVWLY